MELRGKYDEMELKENEFPSLILPGEAKTVLIYPDQIIDLVGCRSIFEKNINIYIVKDKIKLIVINNCIIVDYFKFVLNETFQFYVIGKTFFHTIEFRSSNIGDQTPNIIRIK